MKVVHLPELTEFNRTAPFRKMLCDSHSLRVVAFNFEPGQEMPVHEHHANADLAFFILEGEGVFCGEDSDIPIKSGTLLVMPVSKPHGFKATTRLRLLVFIAPPF
jgi:quercetin dioxygenase-like cupin family protein